MKIQPSHMLRTFWISMILFALGTPDGTLAFDRPPTTGSAATKKSLHLEAIRIEGNQRIKDKVILKYIQMIPGDMVNVDILEQARFTLLATDYFKEVDLSTQPGSERGSVVLNIEVIERTYPIIETGFGYHDLQGWFLTLIGLRLDHAFGVESQTRIGIRLGFHLAGIDAEWEKPAARTGDFGAGVRGYIYSQRHLFYGQGPHTPQNFAGDPPQNVWIGSDWRQFEQQINRAGVEATIQYRAGDATRFFFGLKVDKIDPDSSFTDIDLDNLERPFDELPATLKLSIDQTILTGFLFRLIRDARNHPSHPTSGSFARLTIEANTKFLGGDEIFTKATADVRRHFHLGNGWVSSTRISGGIVSSSAPYFERFYVGGSYSIRGFRALSLSPTDGDNGYWMASEELRWPLISSKGAPPRLTGLIFFDIGQGWQQGQAITANDIESAAGYGFRLRLPWIGTLGIDAGVPLTDGMTDDNFRIHGSLGFSF
jgi:outer membrane protein insertion porin family